MTTIALIDTSGYQHPNGAAIDWNAVKASGIVGVYVKLTEGTAVDAYGPQDAHDAHAAGLHVGVYHFARPDLHRAAAEAAAFNAARAGLPCDLPPVLDTETQPITQAWNDAWLALVPGALGYTYRSARNTLSLPDSRVWIAAPNQPIGDYEGVQWGQGAVPGIKDATDLDTFDSSLIATPAPHGGAAGTMLAPRNDGSGVVDAFIVDANTNALATFAILPDGTNTAPYDVNSSQVARPLGACWQGSALLVLVQGTDKAVYTIRFANGQWSSYGNVNNGSGAPVYTV